MKITLNVEVSSAEELDMVSAALGGLMTGAEVSHPINSGSEEEPASKVTKKVTSKRGSKKDQPEKFDAPAGEQMEPVPSQYAQGTAADVLHMNTQAPQNLVQENYTQPQAQQQPPVQQTPQANFAGAVEHIRAEAGRLEKAGQVPGDAKRNVINALLKEIGAPQGYTASQLPEPYLSTFAARFSGKVDAVIAQFAGGTALV